MMNPQPAEAPCSVLISVLNWNTAPLTLRCIESLTQLASRSGLTTKIFVIDNASEKNDYEVLRQSLDPTRVSLHREPANLGFTGGHNVAIKLAASKKMDFFWMVNSDTVVQADTLNKLLDMMAADGRCGIVSPVVMKMNTDEEIDFAGAFLDWAKLESIFPATRAEYERLRDQMPERLWVAGTASLLRVAALNKVGPLDDRLFAYFDDCDISARMAAAGWVSRIQFDTKMSHVTSDNRKPYYYYLMQRNYLLFWHTQTPTPYHKFLYLKLVRQAFNRVNRLYRNGNDVQADARLLGIGDFILGKYGAPHMDRRAPVWLKTLCRLTRILELP